MNKCIMIMLVALATTMCAMAQGEQRGRFGQGNNPGGFKPSLEGVWQMISLSATSEGMPQLSFLPVLKVFNADGTYQNIGIPDEGGCFISKQCKIEKTSDSTFTETPMMMRRDSVQAEPVVVNYRFRGPMWVTMTFKEPGKTEPTTEIWMRVRSGNRGGQMGQGGGERRQGMGQRPQGQRRGGGFNMPRQNMQVNPFEQNGGGGSISEADD